MNKYRFYRPSGLFVALGLLISILIFSMVVAAGASQSTEAAAKADRFSQVGDDLCYGQAWPNVDASCVSWAGGQISSKNAVRLITIEKRDEARRLSVLVRVPAS